MVFLASLGYKFGDFTLTQLVDFGYGHEKFDDAKVNKFYVLRVLHIKLFLRLKVYGNYLYERAKVNLIK